MNNKTYKSLGDACEDLKAKLVRNTGYKDEMNRIVRLAKLESNVAVFYLETVDGVWTTNISRYGYDILNNILSYCHEGKTVNDFYNFITKNNLTYKDQIRLVDGKQNVLNPQIKISDYLKTLPEL